MAGSLQFTPTFAGAEPGSALAETKLMSPFEVVAVDGASVQNYQDIAMGLGDRLGESGDIVLGVVDLASAQASEVSLQITNWHQCW